MISLSKSDKLRVFIAPKITDLITLLDNNGKSAVYTRWDIHGIYRYLETIGATTTLTTSGQCSHRFSPSSTSNKNAETLHPFIAALCMRQKSICEWCGRIGHKVDSFIIRGPKFLPPSLRRNMNQFNALHGDKPNEPPREWNSQLPAACLKFRNSPSRTNPVISDIIGKLNHRAIDNGDVKILTSYFPVESNYKSVPDPDTTPNQSIDDYELDRLLELFH